MQPIVDLTSPLVKVLIDLGYDWSGNPGDTRYLSILPFSPTTNWLQVGVDLVRAVGEGIENVFGGGSTIIAPADTDDVSPFSARIAGTTSVNEDGDKNAVDGQDVDVVDEVTADSLDGTTPGTTQTPPDETAVDPADAAKAEREAAKAERQAAREAAKAEREAAREAERRPRVRRRRLSGRPRGRRRRPRRNRRRLHPRRTTAPTRAPVRPRPDGD